MNNLPHDCDLYDLQQKFQALKMPLSQADGSSCMFINSWSEAWGVWESFNWLAPWSLVRGGGSADSHFGGHEMPQLLLILFWARWNHVSSVHPVSWRCILNVIPKYMSNSSKCPFLVFHSFCMYRCCCILFWENCSVWFWSTCWNVKCWRYVITF
jgi:hypothetical protein